MSGSTALFASSAGRNQSKNLVEFKAGKMAMKGKMVHPDKRKGLLYIYQSDDSLMHFCWKDRSAGNVEDDLIIFPDDCEFKRVDACTTGRVYVLKFKSSSRKLFFWVQEPKTDKDDDNCKKINEVLNNPPAAGSSRSGVGTPDELHNLLGSMSQQQLMQLFGSFGSQGGSGSSQLPNTISSLLGTMRSPSGNSASSARTTSSDKSSTSTVTSASDTKKTSNTASTSTPTSSRSAGTTSATGSASQPGGQILLSDLQRYLSNMRPITSAPLSGAPTVEVDLSEALTNAESIQGLLNDPSLVTELSPHLPEVNTDEPSSERLRSTLQSPQFQQAVSMFSAALRSGQIGSLVQQFQVGEKAVLAALEGNMEEFVKALESANINIEKKEDEEKGEKKEKDPSEDDEKMNEG